MGKVLEGQCVSGTEALWVAVHGFAFTLAVVLVGGEYFSPLALTGVLAAGGTYLLSLSELPDHPTLQEWLPLTAAVVGAGLLSMGGARYSAGQAFVHPTLASGAGPVLVLSVLAGYAVAAFQLQGLRASGVEEWIPLLLAAGGAGVVSHAGARYGRGESFFPEALTSGAGPCNFLLGLGLFVGVGFLNAVESHKGTWEQWLALGGAATAVGLLAGGGARYAQGGEFFPEALTKGPVPAAVMALLGAFVYTAFVENVGVRGGQGVEEWLPLMGAVVGAGTLAHCGARLGSDASFLPDLLERGVAPLVYTVGLAMYSVLALHAVNEPKGGLTTWMNLAGAASVVGALSFYGGQTKQLQTAA